MKTTLKLIPVLAVFGLGCQDVPVAVESPGGKRPDFSKTASGQQYHPQEQRFVDLARTFPGFGGFFYDAEGNLAGYTTRLEESADLSRELQLILESRPTRGRLGAEKSSVVVVRKGQYTYHELSSWRDWVEDNLLIGAAVTYVDLNEGANRVEVGVLDLAVEGKLRQELEAVGIPSSAVQLVESGPFELLTTLRENVNPEKGGLQIERAIGGYCTLGFIARVTSFPVEEVAVTASHCTEEWGEPDEVAFYQPTVASNAFIGDESQDVEWHWCVVGAQWRRCRHSDSALIGLEVAAAWPHIARTTYAAGPGQGNGSIQIDNITPTMQVYDTIYYPIQGEDLDKIGRTTGWTWGYVWNTDFTFVVDDMAILNAMIINFTCGSGDSGSPVFQWDYEREAARLAGIVFGRTATGLCAFSPWGKILVDYPSLEVLVGEPEGFVKD